MACFFKIIVSNYNNKNYIEKCVKSILIQKFQDFKIIIIDDVSTDGSDKICQKLAERHKDKIQFIQLAQKGYAGKCRNTGLAIDVQSQYTFIIDGDDWLHNANTLQNMYNVAIKNKPDLIRCSYDEYRGGKNIKLIKLNSNFKNIVKHGAAPWKNCFRSCFDNIKFIENRSKCNDVVWFLRLCDVINQKKIAVVPYPCIIYNMISNNSCWHGKNKQADHYIKSTILLIHDLEQEIFKKIECIEYQKYLIKLKRKQFNNFKIESFDPSLLNKNLNIPKMVRKTVIAMASFPARKNGMLNVIQQLYNQCDEFCLWLNDYTEIPTELSRFPKLKIKLAKQYSWLKENGRLNWINEFKDCYYLTVDDDISYPNNYVNKITSALEKYKCKSIVSYHGAIFINNKEKIYGFQYKLPSDCMIHRFGGGVAGMVPNEIGFICPDIHTLKGWDGDASISVWATLHHIKKICLQRDENWLSELIIGNENLSKTNALCLNLQTKRIRQKIYKKIKKWEKIN